ncbi:MAG: nucleotide exchange factor GrpE [Cumulibacter sp.]
MMPGPTDDERGSEVDDYTGEVPRVDPAAAAPPSDEPQPTGFGDGDVADVGDITIDPVEADGPHPADYSRDDIAALIAERDQYKDAAIRLQADFENFRKRSATQNAGEVDRATGRLAEALLPVLDAAEAAFVQHPDEIGPLLNQLLTELKRVGLEALDLEDRPFDPEVAEAVAHQPGDGGEVAVAEVLRSGYTWKGKTLRPAMVRTKD